MTIKILLFLAMVLIILRWFKKGPAENKQPPMQIHLIKNPTSWKSPFNIKQIVGVTEIEYQNDNSFFKVHLMDGTIHKLVFLDSGIAKVYYQSLFDQLQGSNMENGGNA